jgi:hypothetical protein
MGNRGQSTDLDFGLAYITFGRVEEADVDRLQDFAVMHGFDLIARVYGKRE